MLDHYPNSYAWVSGYILEVIITRSNEDQLVGIFIIYTLKSAHITGLCNILIGNQSKTQKTFSFRRVKDIDLASLGVIFSGNFLPNQYL